MKKAATIMLAVGVMLALSVVSCRQAPDVEYKRGLESADRLIQQGDTERACQLLFKMAGEKRFVSYRDELLGRYMACFVGHAGRLSASGQADSVLRQMEVPMEKLPDGMALNLAGKVAAGMIEAGALREAGQINSLIARFVPESAERRGALCEISLSVQMKSRLFSEAQALYRAEYPHIPDESAVRGLQMLGAGLPDGGAALSETVIDAAAGRKRVQETAAGVWVKAAKNKGNGADVARRLVAIHGKGVADRTVMGLMDDAYSVLLADPAAESLAPVYAMCEKMLAASDKFTRRRLAGYLLDMGFFLEKYEESLKLVEDGMLGEGHPQTAMFISKIKGHLALQKGRVDDAIANFRQFMAFIEKEASSKEMDPLDQTWVTCDMILGLNAKRIGDILTKAGRPSEAAGVYKEARGYYEKAIKEFPDEASKENAKIRRSLAEIPSA